MANDTSQIGTKDWVECSEALNIDVTTPSMYADELELSADPISVIAEEGARRVADAALLDHV